MRANEKKFYIAFVLLISAFFYDPVNLFSQDVAKPVSGTVISSDNNQPLSGVSVTVKGTQTGTATDATGQYRLTLPNANATLVFTYTGYTLLEEAVNNRSVINVTLTADAKKLEDVVVIGYAAVRRRDLTGSVSSVNARQLRDIPVNSAAEALSGRLAGVQVTSTEGAPGADVRIRVRGGGSITQNNNPLYIIDGVQVENGLSTLSPQDIESIDVLKDASTTAIYGARGANGVVIITTKGGRNTRTTITYNGFAGIRKLANKLDVMNPYDFVMYQYERSRGNATDSSSFANNYGTFDALQQFKSVPFVDWQEEMFGRNALMQTHNLSLSGGSSSTQYNLSLTSNTEQGVMQLSDFDRKIANFKFDHTFNPKLRVGFITRYNYTVVNGAGTSSEGSSSTNNLRQSIKYRPLLLAGQDIEDYDPNYAAETNDNSLALVNPILLNQAQYRKNNSGVLNLSGYADYKIAKFLTLRSTFGYNTSNERQNLFDDTITNNSKLVGSRMPIATVNTTVRTTLNNSNVLTYSNANANTSFSEKNSLSVLLGHEVYEERISVNNLETRLFPIGISPERAFGNMNLGTPQKPVSSENVNKLLSFFGRLNYAYEDKYLLSLSVRSDGSTKFAAGNKWSYFPSGSLAWRLSKEKFMERLDPVISDLKLRISYGEAGNNRIDNFLYLTQFNTNTQYGLNDVLVTGFSPAALANANLRWETTVSKNLGLDAGFLNNRLLFSVDVYNNKTKDLLVAVPIATTSGYQTQIQNVGSTSNKGVEFQISGTPIQNRNFNWTASFNMSFNKNKVESLGTYQKFYLQNSGWALSNSPADYIVRVGDPVGSMWGLQTDGFYTLDDFNYNDVTGVYSLKTGVPNNSGITSIVPQPGGLKFRDLNGDNVINDLDKSIIGNANPKFFGGLNQQFTYKNFDLSAFVNFQYGNDVYNANKLEFTSGYTANSNMLTIMNDRWRTVDQSGKVLQSVVTINNVQTVVGVSPAELAKVNANATIWSPSRTSTSFVVHSWAIEDGSFVRINNITLGYTLPVSLVKRARVQRLRVYGTINNLAVFTNYSGYDPEVSTRRSNPVTPGVDYSAYPRSRSFIFGVNLSL